MTADEPLPLRFLVVSILAHGALALGLTWVYPDEPPAPIKRPARYVMHFRPPRPPIQPALAPPPPQPARPVEPIKPQPLVEATAPKRIEPPPSPPAPIQSTSRALIPTKSPTAPPAQVESPPRLRPMKKHSLKRKPPPAKPKRPRVAKTQPKPRPQSTPKRLPAPQPAPPVQPKPPTRAAPPTPVVKPVPQRAPEPSTAPTPPLIAGLEPTSSTSAKALQDYLALVSSTFERYKRYPMSARQRGLTGRLVLQFVILQDGQVITPKIIKRTGHRSFSRAALRALRRAGTMPPFPPSIQKKKLMVKMPIAYTLVEK